RARSREGILSGFDSLPRRQEARSEWRGRPRAHREEKMDESPPRTEWGRLFGGSEGLLPLRSRGWDAADHVAAREVRSVIHWTLGFVAHSVERRLLQLAEHSISIEGDQGAGRWMML